MKKVVDDRVRTFGEAFRKMELLLLEQDEDLKTFKIDDLSNVYLCGEGISLLNAVDSQKNRIAQMRKDFVKQLGKIGYTITNFSSQLQAMTPMEKEKELVLIRLWKKQKIELLETVIWDEEATGTRIAIRCCFQKENTTGEILSEDISRVVQKEMVFLGEKGQTFEKGERDLYFVEKSKFVLTTSVLRIQKDGEIVSGDNFSLQKIKEGKVLALLSDGMGSGKRASWKSRQMVELFELLLNAGFERDLSIWLLNSFISMLWDGAVSSSLDLAIIDLYSGKVDFVKLGASTTYIRRADKIECIHSTSLPVGVLEQVEFDTCRRTLYHSDIIVMMSDGVMDHISDENGETYLADFIAKRDTNNVQLLAQAILEETHNKTKKCLKDDCTIMVIGMWERY